jgi:hydrogenase maturation protease
MKHGATKAAEQSADTPQILVIGFGNTLRSDDGAGVALAEKLVVHWLAQGVGVQLLTTTQLLPELAAFIAQEEVKAVVFVDTEVFVDTGGFVDTEVFVDMGIQIAKVELDSTSPSLGHHLDPTTLLVYAHLLYGRTPRAWLVTIPGQDFEHGQEFSPEVTRLLGSAPTVATQLLARILVEIEECVPCMNLPLPKH